MIGFYDFCLTSGFRRDDLCSIMASKTSVSTEDQFSKALAESITGFSFKSLKPEQRECIRRLICVKEDVLAILPTGFGKSIIYQLLPKVLEHLHKDETGTAQFVVIVVSPLDYIRQQQVSNYKVELWSNCCSDRGVVGERPRYIGREI